MSKSRFKPVYMPIGKSSGINVHRELTGLTEDDHTQYHTDARGDERYVVSSNREFLQSSVLKLTGSSYTTSVLTFAKTHTFASQSVVDSNTIIQDGFSGTAAGLAGRTPDTIDNGNVWLDPGNCGAVNGSGQAVYSAETDHRTLVDSGRTDYIIEADIVYIATKVTGIVFRGNTAGTSNFTACLIADNVDLRYDGWSLWDRQSFTTVDGTTYHFKVVVNTSGLQVWIDGTKYIDVSVTTNNSQTHVGLVWSGSTTTTTVDNFTVSYSVSATVVTSPTVLLTPLWIEGSEKMEVHVDAITSTNCTIRAVNLDSVAGKCVVTALITG